MRNEPARLSTRLASHFASLKRAAFVGAAALLFAGCATPSNATSFNTPGVIELRLGEGSQITDDCRIDAYTQRIIDHQGGRTLGCIRFPTADVEDDDFHWQGYYCEQVARQGWSVVSVDDVGTCVHRRPTPNAGCFETLSFEYGMPEREFDEPEAWRDPAHHTFAVVLMREYCPAQHRRRS